jgi:hypothetical protein
MPDSRDKTQSSEPRIEGWKQISVHFKKTERTVRRWADTEGMPVHRHRHGARSSVFAVPSELDAWWTLRTSEDNHPTKPARNSPHKVSPRTLAQNEHEQEEREATRRWEYFQSHPITHLEIFLLLAEAMNVESFLAVLDETHLVLGNNQVSLTTFLHMASPPGTERFNITDHPVCEYWEHYDREPGFWVKRGARNSSSTPLVAGFEMTIPWRLVGVPQVETLRDISLLTDVGLIVPGHVHKSGVEELLFRLVGDTFSFGVSFADLDQLSFATYLARWLNATPDSQDQMKASLSGIELLDHFLQRMLAFARHDYPPSIRSRAEITDLSRSITFFPNVPDTFRDSPESREIGITIEVPARTETDS